MRTIIGNILCLRFLPLDLLLPLQLAETRPPVNSRALRRTLALNTLGHFHALTSIQIVLERLRIVPRLPETERRPLRRTQEQHGHFMRNLIHRAAIRAQHRPANNHLIQPPLTHRRIRILHRLCHRLLCLRSSRSHVRRSLGYQLVR